MVSKAQRRRNALGRRLKAENRRLKRQLVDEMTVRLAGQRFDALVVHRQKSLEDLRLKPKEILEKYASAPSH